MLFWVYCIIMNICSRLVHRVAVASQVAQKGGDRLSHKKKILLMGVLAVLVLFVGLCAWQWNNISAALSFARYSQEELEGKLDQNDQTRSRCNVRCYRFL